MGRTSGSRRVNSPRDLSVQVRRRWIPGVRGDPRAARGGAVRCRLEDRRPVHDVERGRSAVCGLAPALLVRTHTAGGLLTGATESAQLRRGSGRGPTVVPGTCRATNGARSHPASAGALHSGRRCGISASDLLAMGRRDGRGSGFDRCRGGAAVVARVFTARGESGGDANDLRGGSLCSGPMAGSSVRGKKCDSPARKLRRGGGGGLSHRRLGLGALPAPSSARFPRSLQAVRKSRRHGAQRDRDRPDSAPRQCESAASSHQ
ncbi:hypothetical protein SAMN06272739_2328 [Blastococcus haudaquaticus]|uniref:Uncharacterized protein n=1 Tax=Blastococcus haudaquaticus TaxID=1938745 RepID=A0A286GWA5_9ACTN|nr:hypothetical protein SAMN06272739_2328 [Blastococcus haudaquaticus]